MTDYTPGPFVRAALRLCDAGGNVLMYGPCNEVRWPDGRRETFTDDEECRVAIEAYLSKAAPVVVQLGMFEERRAT